MFRREATGTAVNTSEHERSREGSLAGLRAVFVERYPQPVESPFDQTDFSQTKACEVSIDAVSCKERPRPA